MKDKNKRNILYFESNSMKDLHDNMNDWQEENEKRFLSMSINKDEGKYCCIALTNPSEVVIVGGNTRHNKVKVKDGHLLVRTDKLKGGGGIFG